MHFVLFWIEYWNLWSSHASLKCRQELDLLFQNTLVLLGRVCVGNPSNAELVRLGLQRPVMIKRLASLPFEYFLDPVKKFALLPTLIILCFEDETTRWVVEEDVSLRFFGRFIQQYAEQPSQSKEAMAFAARFPRQLWQPAMDLFLPASSS